MLAWVASLKKMWAEKELLTRQGSDEKITMVFKLYMLNLKKA